ncbi:MAG: FAD binding domain-containing protein [Pigmentiphaga sp.]|uniref:FAD binding domain-containing protein n=1 Tax=Pigmentiphaga sp. TaxID=1977564 RepID=UPI0029B52240|nr:FAD binding domain-containing protein [Pigmentiphaga sp.]MDX3904818.1 FAD binding domain-containing protein [Pigmentiphaga sp.]
MKAAPISYRRASTLDEALAAGGETARFLAGGQSLVPMMNLRLTLADIMIDISNLRELRRCAREGDRIFIGAGVTHAMLEDGKIADPSRGYLPHVAGGIAFRSVRNRGTLGGSLAHADPAADWPAALLALGADAVIRGLGGERRLPLAQFQLGLMETALEPGEILLGVSVPVLSCHARWSYQKFCRKSGEFAHSIAAVVCDPARGLAEVVLGAAGDKPFRLERASALLLGDEPPAAPQMALAVDEDVREATGLAVSSYEFHLHRTMALRACARLREHA